MKSQRRVLVRNLRSQSVIASEVEVAATHLRRLVGLLGRTRKWATPGNALWIRPSKGIHTFGMLFPIDVIFLDGELRVVHVQENVRPFCISAVCLSAQSVLELPPFTISKAGIFEGDQLEIVAWNDSGMRTQK
ncbi:MAG TPA: DUF192 domain-containing protein [Terriglobia bacterium]|nr:DUF192 domain-containing protein [Terriglobia bacterium]